MIPRLLPLLLVTACASSGGEGARGQGDTEVSVPPAPEGNAWRTARTADFEEMLEDLAKADVVLVTGDGSLELAVLDYLFRRGRLHAIGTEAFPRTAQQALDDLAFGRIDEAEFDRRCGPVADAVRPVLAFARERRLPLLGLGVERELLDAVAAGGLDARTEEARRSLPAVHAEESLSSPAPHAAEVAGLELDVAADAVVRWYRGGAPEGAQVLVLAGRVAPRALLPERLFSRSGKSYRTLVVHPGDADAAEARVFDRRYADYVWFTGAK